MSQNFCILLLIITALIQNAYSSTYAPYKGKSKVGLSNSNKVQKGTSSTPSKKSTSYGSSSVKTNSENQKNSVSGATKSYAPWSKSTPSKISVKNTIVKAKPTVSPNKLNKPPNSSTKKSYAPWAKTSIDTVATSVVHNIFEENAIVKPTSNLPKKSYAPWTKNYKESIQVSNKVRHEIKSNTRSNYEITTTINSHTPKKSYAPWYKGVKSNQISSNISSQYKSNDNITSSTSYQQNISPKKSYAPWYKKHNNPSSKSFKTEASESSAAWSKSTPTKVSTSNTAEPTVSQNKLIKAVNSSKKKSYAPWAKTAIDAVANSVVKNILVENAIVKPTSNLPKKSYAPWTKNYKEIIQVSNYVKKEIKSIASSNNEITKTTTAKNSHTPKKSYAPWYKGIKSNQLTSNISSQYKSNNNITSSPSYQQTISTKKSYAPWYKKLNNPSLKSFKTEASESSAPWSESTPTKVSTSNTAEPTVSHTKLNKAVNTSKKKSYAPWAKTAIDPVATSVVSNVLVENAIVKPTSNLPKKSYAPWTKNYKESIQASNKIRNEVKSNTRSNYEITTKTTRDSYTPKKSYAPWYKGIKSNQISSTVTSQYKSNDDITSSPSYQQIISPKKSYAPWYKKLNNPSLKSIESNVIKNIQDEAVKQSTSIPKKSYAPWTKAIVPRESVTKSSINSKSNILPKKSIITSSVNSNTDKLPTVSSIANPFKSVLSGKKSYAPWTSNKVNANANVVKETKAESVSSNPTKSTFSSSKPEAKIEFSFNKLDIAIDSSSKKSYAPWSKTGTVNNILRENANVRKETQSSSSSNNEMTKTTTAANSYALKKSYAPWYKGVKSNQISSTVTSQYKSNDDITSSTSYQISSTVTSQYKSNDVITSSTSYQQNNSPKKSYAPWYKKLDNPSLKSIESNVIKNIQYKAVKQSTSNPKKSYAPWTKAIVSKESVIISSANSKKDMIPKKSVDTLSVNSNIDILPTVSSKQTISPKKSYAPWYKKLNDPSLKSIESNVINNIQYEAVTQSTSIPKKSYAPWTKAIVSKESVIVSSANSKTDMIPKKSMITSSVNSNRDILPTVSSIARSEKSVLSGKKSYAPWTSNKVNANANVVKETITESVSSNPTKSTFSSSKPVAKTEFSSWSDSEAKKIEDTSSKPAKSFAPWSKSSPSKISTTNTILRSETTVSPHYFNKVAISSPKKSYAPWAKTTFISEETYRVNNIKSTFSSSIPIAKLEFSSWSDSKAKKLEDTSSKAAKSYAPWSKSSPSKISTTNSILSAETNVLPYNLNKVVNSSPKKSYAPWAKTAINAKETFELNNIFGDNVNVKSEINSSAKSNNDIAETKITNLHFPKKSYAPWYRKSNQIINKINSQYKSNDDITSSQLYQQTATSKKSYAPWYKKHNNPSLKSIESNVINNIQSTSIPKKSYAPWTKAIVSKESVIISSANSRTDMIPKKSVDTLSVNSNIDILPTVSSKQTISPKKSYAPWYKKLNNPSLKSIESNVINDIQYEAVTQSTSIPKKSYAPWTKAIVPKESVIISSANSKTDMIPKKSMITSSYQQNNSLKKSYAPWYKGVKSNQISSTVTSQYKSIDDKTSSPSYQQNNSPKKSYAPWYKKLNNPSLKSIESNVINNIQYKAVTQSTSIPKKSYAPWTKAIVSKESVIISSANSKTDMIPKKSLVTLSVNSNIDILPTVSSKQTISPKKSYAPWYKKLNDPSLKSIESNVINNIQYEAVTQSTSIPKKSYAPWTKAIVSKESVIVSSANSKTDMIPKKSMITSSVNSNRDILPTVSSIARSEKSVLSGKKSYAPWTSNKVNANANVVKETITESVSSNPTKSTFSSSKPVAKTEFSSWSDSKVNKVKDTSSKSAKSYAPWSKSSPSKISTTNTILKSETTVSPNQVNKNIQYETVTQSTNIPKKSYAPWTKAIVPKESVIISSSVNSKTVILPTVSSITSSEKSVLNGKKSYAPWVSNKVNANANVVKEPITESVSSNPIKSTFSSSKPIAKTEFSSWSDSKVNTVKDTLSKSAKSYAPWSKSSSKISTTNTILKSETTVSLNYLNKAVESSLKKSYAPWAKTAIDAVANSVVNNILVENAIVKPTSNLSRKSYAPWTKNYKENIPVSTNVRKEIKPIASSNNEITTTATTNSHTFKKSYAPWYKGAKSNQISSNINRQFKSNNDITSSPSYHQVSNNVSNEFEFSTRSNYEITTKTTRDSYTPKKSYAPWYKGIKSNQISSTVTSQYKSNDDITSSPSYQQIISPKKSYAPWYKKLNNPSLKSIESNEIKNIQYEAVTHPKKSYAPWTKAIVSKESVIVSSTNSKTDMIPKKSMITSSVNSNTDILPTVSSIASPVRSVLSGKKSYAPWTSNKVNANANVVKEPITESLSSNPTKSTFSSSKSVAKTEFSSWSDSEAKKIEDTLSKPAKSYAPWSKSSPSKISTTNTILKSETTVSSWSDSKAKKLEDTSSKPAKSYAPWSKLSPTKFSTTNTILKSETTVSPNQVNKNIQYETVTQSTNIPKKSYAPWTKAIVPKESVLISSAISYISITSSEKSVLSGKKSYAPWTSNKVNANANVIKEPISESVSSNPIKSTFSSSKPIAKTEFSSWSDSKVNTVKDTLSKSAKSYAPWSKSSPSKISTTNTILKSETTVSPNQVNKNIQYETVTQSTNIPKKSYAPWTKAIVPKESVLISSVNSKTVILPTVSSIARSEKSVLSGKKSYAPWTSNKVNANANVVKEPITESVSSNPIKSTFSSSKPVAKTEFSSWSDSKVNKVEDTSSKSAKSYAPWSKSSPSKISTTNTILKSETTVSPNQVNKNIQYETVTQSTNIPKKSYAPWTKAIVPKESVIISSVNSKTVILPTVSSITSSEKSVLNGKKSYAPWTSNKVNANVNVAKEPISESVSSNPIKSTFSSSKPIAKTEFSSWSDSKVNTVKDTLSKSAKSYAPWSKSSPSKISTTNTILKSETTVSPNQVNKNIQYETVTQSTNIPKKSYAPWTKAIVPKESVLISSVNSKTVILPTVSSITSSEKSVLSGKKSYAPWVSNKVNANVNVVKEPISESVSSNLIKSTFSSSKPIAKTEFSSWSDSKVNKVEDTSSKSAKSYAPWSKSSPSKISTTNTLLKSETTVSPNQVNKNIQYETVTQSTNIPKKSYAPWTKAIVPKESVIISSVNSKTVILPTVSSITSSEKSVLNGKKSYAPWTSNKVNANANVIKEPISESVSSNPIKSTFSSSKPIAKTEFSSWSDSKVNKVEDTSSKSAKSYAPWSKSSPSKISTTNAILKSETTVSSNYLNKAVESSLKKSYTPWAKTAIDATSIVNNILENAVIKSTSNLPRKSYAPWTINYKENIPVSKNVRKEIKPISSSNNEVTTTTAINAVATSVVNNILRENAVIKPTSILPRKSYAPWTKKYKESIPVSNNVRNEIKSIASSNNEIKTTATNSDTSKKSYAPWYKGVKSNQISSNINSQYNSIDNMTSSPSYQQAVFSKKSHSVDQISNGINSQIKSNDDLTSSPSYQTISPKKSYAPWYKKVNIPSLKSIESNVVNNIQFEALKQSTSIPKKSYAPWTKAIIPKETMNKSSIDSKTDILTRTSSIASPVKSLFTDNKSYAPREYNKVNNFANAAKDTKETIAESVPRNPTKSIFSSPKPIARKVYSPWSDSKVNKIKETSLKPAISNSTTNKSKDPDSVPSISTSSALPSPNPIAKKVFSPWSDSKVNKIKDTSSKPVISNSFTNKSDASQDNKPLSPLPDSNKFSNKQAFIEGLKKVVAFVIVIFSVTKYPIY